jgi:hypothetical protein
MNKLTVKEFNEQVESLTINNDEQLENANFLAKECNRLIKEVKSNHKDEIAKYHELHKEAKAKEKEELKPLENAKVILKNAIGKYMKEVEQRQLELSKQQEEEQELFGEIITKESKPDLQGTHVRKTWKARVIDESKVPVMYGNHVIRTIDMSKLNDIAKYTQGQAVIDGVEFYQDESVIIR